MSLVDPETGEKVQAIVLMSKDDAADITAKIKSYAGVFCQLVKKAHDEGAWKVLGYPSWAAYCKHEFDYSRSYAYRLIGHAEKIMELSAAAGLPEVSPIGDTIPEGATRNLDVDAVADEIAAATEDLDADDEEGRAAAAAEVLRQRQAAEAEAKRKAREKHAAAQTAASGGPPPDAPEPTEGVLHDDPATADEGGPEGGNPPPAPGPLVVSEETERAAYRAKVSNAIVKCSDFLDLNPVDVVEHMDEVNRESWQKFSEELAAWVAMFDEALIEANTLRSVKCD